MAYIPRKAALKTGPQTYNVAASDLGWKPGEWPLIVDTDIGNGHILQRTRGVQDSDGDLEWMVYEQYCDGVHVRVFND